MSFAEELTEPSFEAREVVVGKDGRTLSRDILEMAQEEFSAAFRHSPMKRAKLRGMKRNAAVVLGNAGVAEDAAVLTRALDDPEPLVREHAAWALGRITTPEEHEAIQARRAVENDVGTEAERRSTPAPSEG